MVGAQAKVRAMPTAPSASRRSASCRMAPSAPFGDRPRDQLEPDTARTMASMSSGQVAGLCQWGDRRLCGLFRGQRSIGCILGNVDLIVNQPARSRQVSVLAFYHGQPHAPLVDAAHVQTVVGQISGMVGRFNGGPQRGVTRVAGSHAPLLRRKPPWSCCGEGFRQAERNVRRPRSGSRRCRSDVCWPRSRAKSLPGQCSTAVPRDAGLQ